MVRFFVLPLVRLYIETVGRAYRRIWYKMPHPLSIDGYHPLAHISLERAVRYGAGPAEVMDVLLPTDETAAAVGDAPGAGQVIVYLHGGGFVACNSASDTFGPSQCSRGHCYENPTPPHAHTQSPSLPPSRGGLTPRERERERKVVS